MTQINRQALVPFSALKIYQLVLDVERYPEFLPWCAGSEVHEQSLDHQLASVNIKKGPLNSAFTTKNQLVPGESIVISLVDGPFSRLGGSWTFKALDDDACKVEMAMDFDMAGPAGIIIKPVFTVICDSLLNAFLERARDLYGSP